MKVSNTNIRLALLSVLIVLMAGCGQINQQQQPSPEAPVPTASIEADCVASYFQKDQAPYITQQQHFFDPETGYFQIAAAEPSGQYKFTLNRDQFTRSKKLTAFLSDLSASFVNQSLATSVFYTFSAGAGLLDTTGFETQDATKVEGQWYQPIQVPALSSGIQITLLRNVDTNRIELVKAEDSSAGTQWLLKSYNLRYSKELNTLVPMKIDVFDIQNGLASKQLMIQFEYKHILKISEQNISE